MEDIGNGAKAAAKTAPAVMVEPSTNSATSAKPPTTKTKKSTAAKKLKPVSQPEALEMLRSAIVYLQLSGIQARYRPTTAGLLLQLDDVQLDGVRFVVRNR